MDESKKVWYQLFAIIAFIIIVEVYLIIQQHYILATSIILLFGLWVFFSMLRVSTRLVQQKILKYLDQNNNEATVAEIINHLHSSTTIRNNEKVTDVTHYSLDKLIQKNMIVRDQERVRKVT
ncbi:MAG: hypothetical protein D3922_02950 [Candidatus Electrothrix sp. AR1]|nr:hypothetical protein [Candidatus Electrothrix sp. AR1]